jgi:hypothetical protein
MVKTILNIILYLVIALITLLFVGYVIYIYVSEYSPYNQKEYYYNIYNDTKIDYFNNIERVAKYNDGEDLLAASISKIHIEKIKNYLKS